LVVIARKAYGQAPIADYPILASKAKYAMSREMLAGNVDWKCPLHLRPPPQTVRVPETHYSLKCEDPF
jgi:hypothetical protein